jgi:hypothetical protein
MAIKDPQREIDYRLRLAQAGPQPSLFGPVIPVLIAILLATDTLLPAVGLLNCAAPLAGFVLAGIWDETADGAGSDGAMASL